MEITVKTQGQTITIHQEDPKPPRWRTRDQTVLRHLIHTLHAQGLSRKRIAKILNEEGFHGPAGGQWFTTSVSRVLRVPL